MVSHLEPSYIMLSGRVIWGEIQQQVQAGQSSSSPGNIHTVSEVLPQQDHTSHSNEEEPCSPSATSKWETSDPANPTEMGDRHMKNLETERVSWKMKVTVIDY